MGAQERQAFNDLLDHNRILELEMREVQARTKLHSDMQQTHVVHPAAALSEQQEKHAALRETVEVDDMHRPTLLLLPVPALWLRRWQLTLRTHSIPFQCIGRGDC